MQKPCSRWQALPNDLSGAGIMPRSSECEFEMLSCVQESGRMVQDWLYEFGQWSEARTPSLCPAVAVPHDMPSSRWCFSSSSQTNYPRAF